jgi:hypothetical protein
MERTTKSTLTLSAEEGLLSVDYEVGKPMVWTKFGGRGTNIEVGHIDTIIAMLQEVKEVAEVEDAKE